MVKVGDAVWFYFLHEFCESEQTHPACKVYPITGKSEMRCRIARVTEVHPTPKGVDAMLVPHVVEGRVHLRVEFQDDDRVRIPGSVGWRPSADVSYVNPHNSVVGLGHINQGWPEPNTWAFEQKTVEKE